MNLVRRKFSRRMAQYGSAGLKRVLARMQEFGWCSSVENSDGIFVRWAQGVEPFLRACGWEEGCEKAAHAGVVRLALFLELLAMEAPPGFAAELVNTRPGSRWAAVLLAEIGRGRYRPAWWDASPRWHEDLRHGLAPMPVLFPQVVESSLARTAQRLAEFGWLDFEVCDVPGGRYCVPGPWRQEVLPLVTLLAARASLPGGISRELAVAGRLSLLLHLRLMKAPADLVGLVMAGGTATDLWAASLAHRVTREMMPLWWDRKPCWHAAVLKGLAEQARQMAG